MKYEIINPSDKCYISTDNERVAKFCCLLLGNGMYGLVNAFTGEKVFGIKMFNFPEEDIIKEFGEPLEDFMLHNKFAIADCFLSFAYDSERTSINDIGGRAKILHDRIKSLPDHPTEKGGN